MYRCQQPPMVQPVVQPVKAKDSFSAHFFRWLRWSAVAGMLIPVGIVFIVQMVWLVQAENELEFKRDMLDRGMNVQEIERVLRSFAELAGSVRGCREQLLHCPPRRDRIGPDQGPGDVEHVG